MIFCQKRLKLLMGMADLIFELHPLTLFHTAWGGHHPLFILNVSNINWEELR